MYVSDIFEYVQLHCCGVESYRDFSANTNFTATGKIIPEACCIKENDILKDLSCPRSPTTFNSYYQTVRNLSLSCFISIFYLLSYPFCTYQYVRHKTIL